MGGPLGWKEGNYGVLGIVFITIFRRTHAKDNFLNGGNLEICQDESNPPSVNYKANFYGAIFDDP